MHESLLIACTRGPAASALASTLGAGLLALPDEVDALEAWREREAGGAKCARIAVGLMHGREISARALLGVDPASWLARAEDPIARWVFALGVAAARCWDDGAIVAVIDRPAPLDCAGFAPESAAADAACALVRSLARSEGARGVRVNAVVTSARLAPATPVAPAPPLASFPGRLEREVVGAVRMLLADDASGVTGQVIAADCGRTW
ncbi:MAG: SDR family oxidoreductase [Deltaproteobacteria bacterium]|nr:SDR family oxidoreductase [Deltaproteobacteria bacterium]